MDPITLFCHKIAGPSGLNQSAGSIDHSLQLQTSTIIPQFLHSLSFAAVSKTSGLNTAAGTGVIGTANGIAGAFSGIWNLIKSWGRNTPANGVIQGIGSGALAGSVLPVIGTFLGGLVGGVVGGALGFIKCGKHRDQIARDQLRAALQQIHLIDGACLLRLANGDGYDIGQDGGCRLKNCDGSSRRAYEIDWRDPRSAPTVGWLNPLGYLFFPSNTKLRTDFVGYLTNAALSNAPTLVEIKANIKSFLDTLQLRPQDLSGALRAAAKTGQIDLELLPLLLNGVDSLAPQLPVPTPAYAA